MARKKNGKGFYVATVFLCLAVCAVLIYVMLYGKTSAARDPLAKVPTVTPQSAVTGTQLSLTEQQLESLIAAAAPEELGLREIQVSIDPQQLQLQGVVSKSAILDQLEKEDTASAAVARSAVALLPEELSLGAGLAVASEQGTLRLTPKSVSLGGFSLDASLLPEALLDPIQQALDGAVAQAGGAITGVQLEEGSLTVGLGS